MPKVLIVDDEIDICEMMAFSFESQGFETIIAGDAVEAARVDDRVQVRPEQEGGDIAERAHELRRFARTPHRSSDILRSS